MIATKMINPYTLSDPQKKGKRSKYVDYMQDREVLTEAIKVGVDAPPLPPPSPPPPKGSKFPTSAADVGEILLEEAADQANETGLTDAAKAATKKAKGDLGAAARAALKKFKKTKEGSKPRDREGLFNMLLKSKNRDDMVREFAKTRDKNKKIAGVDAGLLGKMPNFEALKISDNEAMALLNTLADPNEDNIKQATSLEILAHADLQPFANMIARAAPHIKPPKIVRPTKSPNQIANEFLLKEKKDRQAVGQLWKDIKKYNLDVEKKKMEWLKYAHKVREDAMGKLNNNDKKLNATSAIAMKSVLNIAGAGRRMVEIVKMHNAKHGIGHSEFGLFGGNLNSVLNFISSGSINPEFEALQQETTRVLNNVVRDLSGAQVSNQEAERIRKIIPDPTKLTGDEYTGSLLRFLQEVNSAVLVSLVNEGIVTVDNMDEFTPFPGINGLSVSDLRSMSGNKDSRARKIISSWDD